MSITFFWYQWMALTAFLICSIALVYHSFRLVRPGKPKDLARPAGDTGKGIRYAFTGAMSPARKESAYLHLPTYTAGLLYHMGTFLSFFLFFFFLGGIFPKGWIGVAITLFVCITAISGIAILVKRLMKKELLFLSNPDDFISNALVTTFQVATLILLLNLQISQSSNRPIQLLYYLSFTILMLYLPVGKLRHLIYFFAARYHLGYFFGRRGVWPPENVKY